MAAPARDIPSVLESFAGLGQRSALSFYAGKTLVGRLSYAELGLRVEVLAGALRSGYGIGRGDRVAILAPNRLEVPALMLALLRLGAVAVPLNPASAVEDWRYILDHSGASGLCATRELAERAAPARGSRFLLPLEDLLGLVGTGGALAPSESLADELGAVLYTSGTTGNPKGVGLRQRSLIANAWSMAENFGLRATPQLAVLPLYHAHAFGFGLMTALSTGGHLVFTERLEPFSWAALIRVESVEVTSVVPTLLPMLLAARISRDKVPSLRHILVSSAPLSSALAQDFEARTGIPLIQGWGLSEYTNFACCVTPAASADAHAHLMTSEEVPSVGSALAGTEVRVTAPDGAPVEEGQRGELRVRGHSTMQGYFNDAAGTAAALDGEGWLRTGDEGFFRNSGGRPAFFITGRLKELIIRDAEKYSPLRLERALTAAIPELAGLLVVLGFPHRDHGEEVGAYLEVESLADELQMRLRAAIQSLPVAERPKVVLHGAAPIPRTHTGKIQRRKMQPWFAAWGEHGGALVIAPRASVDRERSGK